MSLLKSYTLNPEFCRIKPFQVSVIVAISGLKDLILKNRKNELLSLIKTKIYSGFLWESQIDEHSNPIRLPILGLSYALLNLDQIGEIRQIHLLESPIVEQYITQYPMDGDNLVCKPRFDSAQRDDKKGKVYINDTQYFDNVPKVAWEFYIGGYQPAQKWLKDRKGRKLEFDDILQ